MKFGMLVATIACLMCGAVHAVELELFANVCDVPSGPVVSCQVTCPVGSTAVDGGAQAAFAFPANEFFDTTNHGPLMTGFEPGGTPSGSATGWRTESQDDVSFGVWVVCETPSPISASLPLPVWVLLASAAGLLAVRRYLHRVEATK